MDKLVGVAIAIGLILYLISEILPVIAIFAGIALVIFLIIKICSSIKSSKEKKRITVSRLTSFLKELSRYTSKNYIIPDKIDDLTLLASSEFDAFINSISVDSSVKFAFEKFCKDFENLYTKSSSWMCQHVSNTSYDISGSSLRRTEVVAAKPEDFLPFDWATKQFTYTQIGDSCFILTPIFIIRVIKDSVSIIDYEKLSISKSEQITVQENTYGYIKGASPIYYRYLHERVNGGPDRRYNYNPSTPVYYYYKQEFNLTTSKYLITSKQSCANSLVNSLKSLQNALKAHPVSKALDVAGFDVSKDEFASVFKEIFSSYGKEVALKKLFISILDDYRVTKEKEKLKPILLQISNDSLWTSILAEDCSYETLDNIKRKLTASTHFEERDITETLAYLGYGLQLQRT